jgi:Zn-dependent protease with chaperone function
LTVLFVLFATGLALLALPAVARRGGRRLLHPDEWGRLCATAIAGGGLVVEVAAVLYAAPTLATSSGIPMLAQLCQRMLAPLAPGGPVAGWTAAAVAATLPALGGIGWARARRAARQAWVERGLGHQTLQPGYELVVLPTPYLVAVSVPALGRAPAGQVVISEGLVDALGSDELDAVLRHEAAHLRHRHDRYLAAAAMIDHAFAWFLPARWSTASLRVALERWADEDAAAAIGDRGLLRQALVSVTVSLVAEPAVAAFSAAETIGERLDALDGDTVGPRFGARLLLYCPGVVLGAVAVAAFSFWATGAGAVLDMAGRCFS